MSDGGSQILRALALDLVPLHFQLPPMQSFFAMVAGVVEVESAFKDSLSGASWAVFWRFASDIDMRQR